MKDQGQGKKRVVEDKISNLPDEVLIHILSYLQTEKAVSSSILSTRWKSLWTFLPTLSAHIYECNIVKRKEDSFLDFVDKALIGHKMPFLEVICITCPGINNDRIISWISAAVELDVRKLELSSKEYKDTLCDLPSSLFTMSNIVTLQLDLCVYLQFPSVSNCFRKLKKLVLCLVTYEDNESVEGLVSSCPVLEELVLNRNGYDGLESFNVSSQSLKRLSLFHGVWRDDELDYVPRITIDCPAVEYIHIDDNVTEEFIVKDLSSVVNAKLVLSNVRYQFHELGTYASHVFELLTMFSDVKTLSVSELTMSTMRAAEGEILPMFHNLKCLEFFGLDDDQWDMTAIIEFLKSTPVLEVLTFEGFTFSGEEFNSSGADVPNCLISHLKRIEVNGYLGRNDEKKVRYFLQNSKVLEKMIFKRKGVAEIGHISCGSSACQVVVS